MADLEDLRDQRRRDAGPFRAGVYYWRQLGVHAVHAAAGHTSWSGVRSWRGAVVELSTDARYALRAAFRGASHATVMVLTLALGIGAVTTVFGLLNNLLLAPLPFAEPDRLVVLREVVDAPGRAPIWYTPSARALHVAREFMPEIESAAGHRFATYLIEGIDGPTQSVGVRVTAGFFSTLGVQPALGRGFSSAEEASEGAARVALLEQSLWERALGGDPESIGGTVLLNGVPHLLVGVMPAGFRFPWGAGVWVLTDADPTAPSGAIGIVARLAPGVGDDRLAAGLAAATRVAARLYPESHAEIRFESLTLRDYLVGNRDGISMLLFVAVSLLLLLACANVGGLATVRVLGRQRELAIRCALGCGRRRLFRLVFLEGGVLAVVGGVAGLALAAWLGTSLASLTGAAQSGIGLVSRPEIDARVMLFTAMTTGLAALLAGTLPARRAVDVGRAGTLARARGGAIDPRTQRVLTLVVVGQAAVAASLITFAGAIGAAYVDLEGRERGYAIEQRRAVRVVLPEERFPGGAGRWQLLEEMARSLTASPEVVAAGYTHHLPMTPGNWPREYTLDAARAEQATGIASARWVGRGYLSAMGLGLLAGRHFHDGDVEARAPVAIVSAELADRSGLGAEIVGHRLRLGRIEERAEWLEIIGVVEQAREEWTIGATFYVPYSRRPHEWVEMVVHERPGVAPGRLAELITAIAPDQPVDDIRTLGDLGAAELRGEQLATGILVAMAVAGLAIAALGTYGLVSFRVRRQRHELGVRLALGCPRGRLTWLVTSRGVARVLAGVIVGLPVTALLLAPMFGRAPTVADLPEVQLLVRQLVIQPLNAAIAVVVILLAAIAACLGPAVRAARTDPREVLAGD